MKNIAKRIEDRAVVRLLGLHLLSQWQILSKGSVVFTKWTKQFASGKQKSQHGDEWFYLCKASFTAPCLPFLT